MREKHEDSKMKEKWETLKAFMKKAIFWILVTTFIYMAFTSNILSPISGEGILGICVNAVEECKYSILIQY